MNVDRYQRYEDEAGISIVDMLFYILGKWRALIIFLVVGLLLGCGMYVMQSSKKSSGSGNAAQVLTLSSDTEEALAQLEAKLSSDSLDDLAVAYQYRQKYEEVESYIYSSMYMLLDADGFYRGVLRYYISDSEYTTLIAYMYQAIYYEEGLWEELAEASGLDCDPETLYEIFSIVITPDDSVAHEEPGYRVVTFTINAPDEASCTGMMDLIRSKVEAVEVSARSEYGDFSVAVLVDAIDLVTDDAYLGTQNTYTGYLDTYHTKYTTYEAAFTAVETAYYKIAYLGVSPESIGTLTTAVVTEEEETSASMSPNTAAVLFPVIAVVLWVVWYVFRYFSDGKVKQAGMFAAAYHLPLIGNVESDSGKKTVIDRAIRKLERCFSERRDSLEYLSIVLSEMDCDNIVLASEMELSEIGVLENDLEHVCRAEWSSLSKDGLTSAKKAGTEIIVIRLKKTRRDDVRRELECCKVQGIEVLGFICVS